ncbi:hypothetical protein SynBIOSU31_02252 [Synechococcus sp. BIOS-U3-1]|nr:hypothetical protein SynBIOSU31_02252 [Synechococcus sp. BIOS-U3-1]
MPGSVPIASKCHHSCPSPELEHNIPTIGFFAGEGNEQDGWLPYVCSLTKV